MEQRGKIAFNINDQSVNYNMKKKNFNADLHINKNFNIFEDRSYQRESTDDSVERMGKVYIGGG